MLLSIAPVTMAADTADDGYQKGEIIEFGSYPQSEVTDADEVAKLEADSENYLWVSYKYYSGTGDRTDGKMESGDFMLYKDFYSDGEMFRAVTFRSTDRAAAAD